MTNNDIKRAAFDLLIAARLGYPTAWPGIKFTPPRSGGWLEVEFFPNSSLDNGLSYRDKAVPRGIFQVTCMARSGGGSFTLGRMAEQVHAVFPKGQRLAGMVRVIRQPYDLEFAADDDRMGIAVTVEYSG